MLTLEKEASGLVMTGDALQEGKSIADSVACVCCECRWTQKRVYGSDLLQESGHNTKGVPQDESQVLVLLPLLAEVQEGSLPASVGAICIGRGIRWIGTLAELANEVVDRQGCGGSTSRTSACWNGWS